jgi:ribosomal protein L7/L12
LDEAGFDVTFEQVVGMKKGTVLRRSHDPSAGEGSEISEFGDKLVSEHRPQSREGSQHWEAQMKGFISDGRKIEAIKVYRRATGSGLKDAKEHIESLM